ncbi:MAG TPA: hypothetical protein VKN99_25200, partial [Polyangia bacterium]|nr:hypothetical protein [Polyangia bacterium]
GGSGGTGGTGGTGGAPDAGMDSGPDGGPICAGQPADTRVCLGSATSGHCDGTGGALIDRVCPPDSTCSSGYCQPPPGGACATSSQCLLGRICMLFVSNGGSSLQGSCSDPYIIVGGGGFIYQNCTSGGQCRSGICATDADDTSLNQCLYPCRNDNDCPMGGGCHAISAPSAIEGTSTSGVKGCFR